MIKKEISIKLGDIVLVELKGEGSLQHGLRPCLVVSNDKCNMYSPIVTVIPFTTQKKKPLPFHVDVLASEFNGLSSNSTLLVEQKTLINKTSIYSKLGRIEDSYQMDIGYAILTQEPLLQNLIERNTIN